MKKLFFFSVAGLLALSANAQYVQHSQTTDVLQPVNKGSVKHTSDAAPASRKLINAKVTAATAFVTDTFNANSLGSGGWTTGGNTGAASWRFTNQASAGDYGLGTITSTSRLGGWMLYDADSIGKLFPTTQPQIGYLTSPSYSCTGHSYVGVRFQQYTRRLRDTFFVLVSNDNGVNFTRYPIYPNNALGGNEYLDNPTVTTINISAVAANQANVKVRFYYTGVYPGGTYNWMVDDFQLLDLDAVDLSVSKSILAIPLHNANGFTAFGSIPLSFVDSLSPRTNLYNYGGTAQTNATVTATIYNGGAPVYTKSMMFPSIAINGSDSLANYYFDAGGNPQSFPKPTAAANLTTVFSVNQSGDGTSANNTDSVFNRVSDSVWSMYRYSNAAGSTILTGGYYLQRRASGTSPAIAFYTGSLFEVGVGKSDTLTSVDVPFYPASTTGKKVRVEIYKQDATDPANPIWISKYNTETRTLTAADIPATFGSVIWTKFMTVVGSGAVKNWAIFDEGEWAVVITGIGFAPSDQVVVYNADGQANLAGKFGLSDTSNGTGNTFGSGTAAQQSNESVPLMRLNFSNDARHILVSVPTIAGVTIGNAYPNPANNTLSIPVSVTTSAVINVSMSNMVGQVLKTQSLGSMSAGQSKKAVFNTSDLAAGMYMYTIESDGQRVTNRVVVAH